MQYVRSISGSVSKTWNSINPATLSGAIDVIVIEQEDGTLACSPFHVRFGKFSLLRPYEKKVEFRVNGVRQNYAMKLGEGGEAFFVFETKDDVPESLQTSPLVSPTGSPKPQAGEPSSLQEPEFLDLDKSSTSLGKIDSKRALGMPPHLSGSMRASTDIGLVTPPSASPDAAVSGRTRSTTLGEDAIQPTRRAMSEDVLTATTSLQDASVHGTFQREEGAEEGSPRSIRSQSPPPLSAKEAFSRAMALSKKLSTSNIPTHVTETGDLMLDMTGYKSSEEDALRAEIIARKILAEELEGNYDIGALIGADEKGNLWIYSSEEAKEARQAATRQATMGPFRSSAGMSDDAVSDPGYHSDSDRSLTDPAPTTRHHRTQSDVQPGFPTPPHTPTQDPSAGEQNRNYAKTLRLTSDQLKALDLKPGANPISFSVNKAICPATMYLWNYKTPIVISDIDGTITKSDALGHVLNMIGRDWTHLGVAKLYTDIVNNGYNIMYLTSRSTGQADITRTYLNGVCQEGYRLPKGPVIMSPDRTIAALRREIYLRKPEVFKMACLRDILSLFPGKRNPFYAGFGNRLTDALSYRSVNIPSSRIFTINSNAEVSLDLLSLNKYKSSYVTMRELVDHFFPPVTMLVQEGGEECTDFTYWREPPPELEDFSSTDTEDEEDELEEEEEDEYEEEASDMEDEERAEDGGESYVSRPSLDDSQFAGSVADEDVYDTDAEEESEDEDMTGDGGVTLNTSVKHASDVNLPLR
ncbi:putative lipin Smp2 [Paecilomyces variotii]|uniref:Putative lipin Smp2 n=1 Tax=Byssochlamys spectabilis TaxID=264951 RepID=A0A443HKE9_BYSSP|nr:putative lipin Smp2 [Paecilomyces variotii]KAJ9354337.1 hypothetical protein DTO280E4_6959 [Paecilomyces variotii]RWQ92216.1 putative lipin Smp2 [Paecilomyces variotii]